MDEYFNPIKEPTRREYTAAESVYAWICLFGGYLFCRVCPIERNPMGCFLLILFLFAASTGVLICKGVKLTGLPIGAAVSAVILSGALVLSANSMIRFFSFCYAMAVYCYYLYAANGNAIKKGFTDFIAVDFFKALLVMPFHALGHLFRAMFSGKAKKAGNFISRALLGMVFAILPTIIVMGLLSYDQNFSALLEKLLDFESFDLISHFFSILFGIPVGMFLYGAFIASSDRLCQETMTEENCRRTAGQLQIAPAVTILAAVLPLIFVYVVFFISQWSYYISGFTGILPENFSYSEYAREGFFQLCAVSALNLFIIAAVAAFMRRKKQSVTILFKIIALTFSLFTLVLISTAMAKLVMYIDFYGLTPRRVHAAWFMAVLAVVFLLVIAKQFAAKLPLVASAIVIVVVMFGGLSLGNVDGYIAKYNVDRYVEGTLETVDIYAMKELGLAAVPQMARLADLLDARHEADPLYEDTLAFLKTIRVYYFDDDPGLFSYTLPYFRAKQALFR